jgi:hypothetical protein
MTCSGAHVVSHRREVVRWQSAGLDNESVSAPQLLGVDAVVTELLYVL